MRVGYIVSEKKAKKLCLKQFEDFCREHGVEVVKLDLDTLPHTQGPLDLIFHKLTDQIALANQGDIKTSQQLAKFQDYCASHPDTVILDPLENVSTLLDRHVQYKCVQDCRVVEENCDYFMPAFVEFTTDDCEVNKQLMEEYGVEYPFVCKPSVAHGTGRCHKMKLIFNEQGLKDVEPPCVAQTFINHNATLYKMFVLGNIITTVRRPSLKNFSAGSYKTIYFDSQDVSRADSVCYLNQLDETDLEYPLNYPKPQRLEQLAVELRRKLGLDLFGIDVILENHTGRCAVIDINAFPSYIGVDGFFENLLELIRERVRRRDLINSGHDACPEQIHHTFLPETFSDQESFQTYNYQELHQLNTINSGIQPNNDQRLNDSGWSDSMSRPNLINTAPPERKGKSLPSINDFTTADDTSPEELQKEQEVLNDIIEMAKASPTVVKDTSKS